MVGMIVNIIIAMQNPPLLHLAVQSEVMML
jgi:hypothetical protein